MDIDAHEWSRQFFVNGSCTHYGAEPVTTVDGVHVGYLCPKCDAALPASWRPGVAVASSATALGGVGAYWVEESAAMVNGHRADACPARVEITALRDAEPQYIHGNCQTKETRDA